MYAENERITRRKHRKQVKPLLKAKYCLRVSCRQKPKNHLTFWRGTLIVQRFMSYCAW